MSQRPSVLVTHSDADVREPRVVLAVNSSVTFAAQDAPSMNTWRSMSPTCAGGDVTVTFRRFSFDIPKLSSTFKDTT
jgi:hypothetical protein